MTDTEYTCEHCGGTFPLVRDETWSDEKAEAEALAFFGPIPIADRVIVCDTCYRRIMEWGAEREAAIVETVEQILKEET